MHEVVLRQLHTRMPSDPPEFDRSRPDEVRLTFPWKTAVERVAATSFAFPRRSHDGDRGITPNRPSLLTPTLAARSSGEVPSGLRRLFRTRPMCRELLRHNGVGAHLVISGSALSHH